MTMTVRTSNGRNAVYIEADYGQGRRGNSRLIKWCKITLTEYTETLRNSGIEFEDFIEILKLFDRGYAWEAYDGESYVFRTWSEARDWAHSRDC